MPPDPNNSLICSVFLALAAAGPHQCERLEPPVLDQQLLKQRRENYKTQIMFFYWLETVT